MEQTLEQNMAIVMGQKVPKELELSRDDKEKLSAAYFKLYFGLTFANWLRGGTLGAAWHRAMQQVAAMINSKNAANPAAMYLRQVHAAHKARWAKVIMTNPNRDKEIECSDKNRAKWTGAANKNVGDAMATVNGVLAAYKSAEKPDAKPAQYATAAQKLQAIIISQMKERQLGRVA